MNKKIKTKRLICGVLSCVFYIGIIISFLIAASVLCGDTVIHYNIQKQLILLSGVILAVSYFPYTIMKDKIKTNDSSHEETLIKVQETEYDLDIKCVRDRENIIGDTKQTKD